MFDQGQGGEEHAVGTARPAAAAAAGSVPNGTRSGPNGNGGDNGAAGAGAGAGGALGASWGDVSSGPETEASNPLFQGSGAAVGGGGSGGGAVVGQAPPSGGGGKTAALGDGVPAPEVDIVEVMGQQDDGAGVFGAILHEPGECVCVWAGRGVVRRRVLLFLFCFVARRCVA